MTTPDVHVSPAEYAAHAEDLIELAGAGNVGVPPEVTALQGIGFALLAINSQLADGAVPRPRKSWLPWRNRDRNTIADGNAAGVFMRLADVVTRVSGAGTAGEHAEAMLAGYRAVMASLPAADEEPAPAQLPDETVLAALAELHALTGWRRLEVGTPDEHGYAGYCVTADGRQVLTADALRNPDGYPAGVTELAALLGASGWRRLEIIGGAGLFGGQPHGWCERANGTGVSLAAVLERAARIPEVTVPRYAAPRVTVTWVTEVISPEPADGRMAPGHYQQILLNTRSGELTFHESAEHREPLDPPHADGRAPRDTWKRWHPGELFTRYGTGGWSAPVPELIAWVIDSGNYVPELPYLNASDANALLHEVAPYAQGLLDHLFDAGELSWSAWSAREGHDITGLCSRNRRPLSVTEDGKGRADYGDIVARFPQVYRPELLSTPPGKLADRCDTITRCLGANEHWHPEVKEAFGAPYSDGSGLELAVLGVRAWYRAAAGVTS